MSLRGKSGTACMVAEGYWPATAAGDGHPVVTQKFIQAATPDVALSIAGAAEPRTVWYIAYPAEDVADLREWRDFERARAGGYV